MARRRSIFVSHSSKDRALTEVLVEVLKQRAAGGDPEIWVDFWELVAGGAWPRQLHEKMARCDAALIILTADALESPWVLKEATILTWRHWLDRHFPVFLPDATSLIDDVKSGPFGPTFLDHIQQLRAAASDPEALAAELLGLMGSKPAPTLFDDIVEALADVLETAPPRKLRSVAVALGIDPPLVAEGLNREEYLEQIARALIVGDDDGIAIDKLFEGLSNSWGREPLRKMLNLLAPFWVDAEAAGRLRAMTAVPPACVLIDGDRTLVQRYTAEMYVRRAFPLSPQYHGLIRVPGGSAGDFVDHVTREVVEQRRARREDFEREPDSEILKRLAELQRPFFVALPFVPDEASLEALKVRFPKAVFLVGGDPVEPSSATCLKPTLKRDVEQREFVRWEEAKEAIESS